MTAWWIICGPRVEEDVKYPSVEAMRCVNECVVVEKEEREVRSHVTEVSE